MKPAILVVDDDVAVCELLQDVLSEHVFTVLTCHSGQDAVNRVQQDSGIALVLLDMMLPDINGLQVLLQLQKQRPSLPVVMLTGLGSESDVVVGLEMGADDYVTKPLELRELVVRVKNLLWRIDLARQAQPETKDNCYQFAGYCLNVSRHTLELGDETIKLTRAEYEMLVAFVTNPGEILSRERLLRMLSARRVDNPDLRTVDVLIRRLRHKLRADLLVTQHGEGYFLAADVY